MNSIYTHDWFDRNAETYTSTDTRLKLDWESLIGNQYSKYLYSQSIVGGLLSNNLYLVRELQRILTVLNLSSKSLFIDNTGDGSYTDGNNIVVSRKHANTLPTEFDTMDVIMGLLIHEASHCLYTDFSYIRYNMRGISEIVKWVDNIIEDELIETRMGHEHPGYANFLAKTKYYYFGTIGHDLISNMPVNELDQILHILLYVVRYPKQITDIKPEILDKYADLFTEIHSIMERYECFKVNSSLTTTVRSLDAAFEIEQVIKKYLDDKVKENPYEDEEDDGTPDEDEFGNKKKAKPRKDYDEQKKDVIENRSSTYNREIKINAFNECSTENSKNVSKFQKRIDELRKSLQAAQEDAIDGIGCKLGFGGTKVNNVNRYNKLRQTIEKYIPIARSLVLTNAKREITTPTLFQKNGRLDTSRLALAVQGHSAVYTQMNTVSAKSGAKYALVLLLDESGSMYNVHDYVTSLAIMIAEVVKDYPEIELYVYGHGDKINTYMDKHNRNRFVIGSSELQGNQNDVEAYKAVLTTVRKQTNLPIVSISFTDSCYCEYSDMKALFDNYRKKNVSFNLVCINDYDNKNYVTVNNDLYGEGNWVCAGRTTKDTETVIKKLAKLIRANYDKRK